MKATRTSYLARTRRPVAPAVAVPMVAALVVFAAAPVAARAAPTGPDLFRRTGGPAAAQGVAATQALEVDRAALADLRRRDGAVLERFPLGTTATATLDLEAFSPFSTGARAVVVEQGTERALDLPGARYFRGRVEGDPDSIVLLVAGDAEARGFVATGGTVYRFGRDRLGTHRSWDLRNADPAALVGPGDFCGNAAAGDAMRPPGAGPATAGPAPAIAAAPAPSGDIADGTTSPVAADDAQATPSGTSMLATEVAIDTDNDLLALFNGNTAAALDYLGDLAAAVSAIYAADAGVQISFGWIRLWSSSDPWTSNDAGGLLGQVRDYWRASGTNVDRDIVHLVSGKGWIGGVAYLNVLCNGSYGYGVSGVDGAFDAMDPWATWDIVVVAHEIGHNFGSDHTHCYSPPIDECYSGEGSGCWSGPESVPEGGGTLMSYCHLLTPGMPNVRLRFGSRVGSTIRDGAQRAACLAPVCGDGQVDAGEDCDDGNRLAGDCCSPSCTFEANGSACNDGNACTLADACSSGRCTGAPAASGTPCDDGSLCTTDACVAGACVGSAVPATGCRAPVSAGRAKLVLKDKANDSGDLLVWTWTKGQATSFADFGRPDMSDRYALCIYSGGTPTPLVSLDLAPGGSSCAGRACWMNKAPRGFLYTDKLRTRGIDKAILQAGSDGAAKIQVKGKGEHLAMPALGGASLPLRVQLRGSDGHCWESTFSTARKRDATEVNAISD